MKFDNSYENYLKRYTLNEGVLGTTLKNIGKGVFNTLKTKIIDEPNKMGVFSQGYDTAKQDSKTQRESQRTKEGTIFTELQAQLQDDPRFINTAILFTDSEWNSKLAQTQANITSTASLSRGSQEITNSKPINKTPYTYKELTAQYGDSRTRSARNIDSYQIEGVKEFVASIDLRRYNLFDNNVKNKIKQKCEELVKETNKKEKQKMGEDYEEVKTSSDKVILFLENEINKTFKPLGESKDNSGQKLKLLFMLVSFGDRTGFEIKR